MRNTSLVKIHIASDSMTVTRS